MTDALKWAGESRDVIEGMLAPYGGPDYLAGKDFHGEFFSPRTDFALEWFKDWQRPLLYNHGLDGTLKTDVVGRIRVEPTDKGLWMQAQLDRSHAYYGEIASLLDSGALGLSSGSVGHLVSRDGKSGEIKAWPLIEGSMTPTPANPDAKVGYAMKAEDAVEHLAVLGIEAPAAVKAEPEISVKVTADTTEFLASIDAIKAALAALPLTPQALHDAALASGAACRSSETPEPPALGLAIAGKSTEQPAVDLVAIKAQLTETAIALAKELTGQ